MNHTSWWRTIALLCLWAFNTGMILGGAIIATLP